MVQETGRQLSLIRKEPLPTPEHEGVAYRGGFIELSSINVLPQGRKTFDRQGIEELAEDMADKGQINPPLVAKFTRQSAQQYLSVINELWEDGVSIETLTSTNEDDQDYYYVLIAGERRYRGSKLLTQHACTVCAKEYGQEGCFDRHFPQGLEVRVSDNIPPMEAIYRQASENTHNALLPYEEAYYLDRMFRVASMRKPGLSLTEFARRVGKGEEKLRDALRFCSLPEGIQQLVEEKVIPYGVAVEVARMADDKAPDSDIEHYIKLATVDNMTVSSFSKLVSRYIEMRNSGNIGLFEDTSLDIQNVKQIAEKESARAFWIANIYLQKISVLFSAGLLGREDSPFSGQGPVNALKSYVRTISKLLPVMIDVLPKQEIDRLQAEFKAHQIIIEALDKNFVDAKIDIPLFEAS